MNLEEDQYNQMPNGVKAGTGSKGIISRRASVMGGGCLLADRAVSYGVDSDRWAVGMPCNLSGKIMSNPDGWMGGSGGGGQIARALVKLSRRNTGSTWF